jgi:tetratricopeptide (TPR) repeat protein
VSVFINYINSGEYLKAAEHYNAEIYGNATLEIEASNEIINLLDILNKGILSGEKTDAESKKIIIVIDNVLSNTNIVVSDYDTIKTNIGVSIASKAAFSAAKELETLKKYTDAITEYKKVIDTDSNYNEAQIAIERCTATLKQTVFDKVETLVGNNEYISAIAQLKELSTKLPEDDEIIAKISVYEKVYISNTIETAAAAFVTPSKDYSNALSIINSALQYYPDNIDLNAKKNYYQTFAPVYLFDMTKLKGEADTLKTDTDIYGNSYEKCFWAGYNSMLYNSTDISYNLSKTYNTFTATVYCRSKKNDVQNMTVEIYADGKLVFQKLKIADNATTPFTINLDVTGVTELRIVLDRDTGAIASGIGMTDMIVQKTTK